MAAITPIVPTLSGVASIYTAASAGGDTIKNPRGTVKVRVKNGGGAGITATISAQLTTRAGDGTYPNTTIPNISVSVGAGQETIIGPVPSAYTDIAGNINLTYSSVTSVTVQANDEQ